MMQSACVLVLALTPLMIANAYEYITAAGVKHYPALSKQIAISGTVSLSASASQSKPTKKSLTTKRKSYKRFINRCLQRNKYQKVIERISERYQVDAQLVTAVIAAESCFNPKAVSPKGAQGLMQLMPFTAKRFGVSNSFDPMQNIMGGVKYLRFLIQYFKGDIRLAVAAYNAGEGAVNRYKGVPPYKETRAYVKKVLAMIDSSTFSGLQNHKGAFLKNGAESK